MVTLLLLFAATLANAASTVRGHNESFDAPARPANSDSYSYAKFETLFVTGPADSRLANVAAEIVKPPADFSGSQAAAARVKSLPHIPGTLLMVLTGFICVSLVRDRKTWLTILIGLIWIGQAGFHVLPQLASHLMSKKQINKRDFSGVTNLCRPVYSHRLRSDIDGTYYIGLLHYLAGIPAAEESFLQIQESGLAAQFHRRFTHLRASIQTPLNGKSFASAKDELHTQKHSPRKTHPSATIRLQSLFSRLTNYPAPSIEQTVYILSKLVLISLIRGPPNPA
jgi:hypothetical protein